MRQLYITTKLLCATGTWLWVLLLLSAFTQCSSMGSSAPNPVYKHKPEEYFPAGPALEVARAIRQDDVDKINILFRQHPELDPNLAGKNGVTLLFWAYSHHHVRSMQELVRHRADVNQPLVLPNGEGGQDVTHLINIATEGPKDELLIALLDLGADPNSRDERKMPALHNALYINNYKRMKILLDHGADINITNSSGATAATVLARLNSFEMVAYLLEHGADWRLTDGEVALHTQENSVGNAEATQWQIKVKQLLMERGAKFPVPSSGAARYREIRARWEQTPEGSAWRQKLDALGARPEVVGKPWVQQEDAAIAEMEAWMKTHGIPTPPLLPPKTTQK